MSQWWRHSPRALKGGQTSNSRPPSLPDTLPDLVKGGPRGSRFVSAGKAPIDSSFSVLVLDRLLSGPRFSISLTQELGLPFQTIPTEERGRLGGTVTGGSRRVGEGRFGSGKDDSSCLYRRVLPV